MASCLLPIAGSMALAGRCGGARKRKPCSSTQGFAYWNFPKGGVEDRQQHCQGATGSLLHPKKGTGMIFAIRNL